MLIRRKYISSCTKGYYGRLSSALTIRNWNNLSKKKRLFNACMHHRTVTEKWCKQISIEYSGPGIAGIEKKKNNKIERYICVWMVDARAKSKRVKCTTILSRKHITCSNYDLSRHQHWSCGSFLFFLLFSLRTLLFCNVVFFI